MLRPEKGRDGSRTKESLTLVILGILFLLSRSLNIETVEGIPLCLFYQTTHLECPGCGLIRSFISLSHGRLLDAVRWNAMGPLICLFSISYGIRSIKILLGKSPLSFSIPPGSLGYRLFGLLFLGQWIFKLVKGLS